MRKVNLIILIFTLGLFIFSCKPKDETNPKIFLNGDNPKRVILQSYYDDDGAYADDNFDGSDITSTMSVVYDIPGMPDGITDWKNLEGVTSNAGTYTVTYTVTDKAENITSLDRIVTVYNQSERFAVDYYVDKSSLNELNSSSLDYTGVAMSVSPDSKVNNRILFPKLSQISGLKVYGNIRDSIIVTVPDTVWRKFIDIPYQEMEGTMSNGNIYDFHIEGCSNLDGNPNNDSYFTETFFFYKFIIKYTIDRLGGGGQDLNDEVIEVYTKI